MSRPKRAATVIIAALLMFGLSGCKKSGTVDWVEWSRSREGSSTGSCRVGVRNAVDEDGNSVGINGKTRFTVRGVTYNQCHGMYKEGNAVEWGSK